MNYYFTINEDNNITGVGITPDNTYPEKGAIKCTKEQSENIAKYKICEGRVVLKNDNELSAQKLEQDKQLLMGQAQQLLNASDYRATVDKMESYTPEKQTAVKEYREALREVIRQAKEGVLIELPTPNF